MKPLLSLIVPSFNMERFLPICLDSVLVGNPLANQIEILVVNDGSTDGTAEIAQAYKTKFPDTVRVINKTNGNYGSCINAALPLVSGTYVKILDADDTFDSEAFVKYLTVLSSIPEGEKPDVVVNDFVEVDLSGTVNRRREFGDLNDTSFSLSFLDPMNGRTLWMHSLAYRTDIVRNIGYQQLEGISYTDQQWVAIPTMAAKTFRRIPQPVYRYLVGRPGQTMDPAVRLKNFSQHIPVQQTIIEAYVRRMNSLSVETKTFVRGLILTHLSEIYRVYLVKHPSFLRESEVASFDLFLKNSDATLFSAIENDFVSITKWQIRFHYVREWRKHNSRKTAKFRLFDQAIRLRDVWHRIKASNANSIRSVND